MKERVNKLTKRQLQILELYAAGYTGTEAAEQLFLSVNTMRNYLKTARRRTGAKTTTQLVAWCVSEKIILLVDEKNTALQVRKLNVKAR